ncbi:macro domain-containing protein [Eubacterium oxidoreducens]|uniref:O-acetyl-ADP-ribose deacetylase (Regulator of RNase III), contains Macro domain n=1 Tax=Eubacterium oxidoreducens TaxID=1732 RepID=A0A1G6AYY9_EUBOX|nr:macro domain-containing protein [Eubacterium oxidoreducens]SDB13575.1 O-acetyl-ADP-ribose deacetylase (regulator of RNase III), contains Macro domain [Eubacterium oxidoreducens]
MSLKVIRDSIINIKSDAIINPACRTPEYKNGVDRLIYETAGKEKLLAARQLDIGVMSPGEAKKTLAYNLKDRLGTRFIIHTFSTTWKDGSTGEKQTLADCYLKSFSLAYRLGCTSIATPILGTGTFSYPRKIAIQIALSEAIAFLLDHDMDIILVVYDEETTKEMKKIFPNIEEHVGYQDVVESSQKLYLKDEHLIVPQYMPEFREPSKEEVELNEAMQAQRGEYPEEEKTVQEQLFAYMNRTNLESSDIYSVANISRKTFSGWLNGKKIPQKENVWKLIFALRLNQYEATSFMNSCKCDMEEMRDKILLDFLKENIYNIKKINKKLEENNMKILEMNE